MATVGGSGTTPQEAAAAQRRDALRKGESAARALAEEFALLRERYAHREDLRNDLHETESRIRAARFSIGRLSSELQEALSEFSQADTIEMGSSISGAGGSQGTPQPGGGS